MKLPIHENIMDAYIQDVIECRSARETEALNEGLFFGKDSIFNRRSSPERSLCFKVDFNAIGNPEDKKGLMDYMQSDTPLRDILGDVLDSVLGKAQDVARGRGISQRRELEIGRFGSGQAWNSIGNLPIVSQTQASHDEETKKALIGTLLEMGYSEKQIGLALRNGAIQCGNFNEATTPPFIPLPEKKQKKTIDEVAKLTKPSKIYSYYINGDQDGQNNNEPEPVVEPEPDIEPEPQPSPEPQGQDQQGGNNNGDSEFPWDNYPYDAFPWDDYQARPTPRAPRQSNTQKQQPGNTQSTQVGDTGNTQIAQPVDNTQTASSQTTGQVNEPIAQTSEMPNLQTGATTNRNNGLAQPASSYPQNVVDTMQKTAALNPNIASQREQNRALRQIKQNTLNKMRSPEYAEGNKALQKNDINTVKNAYKNIKRGNNNPAI